MNPPPAFTGFPRNSLTFFKDLSENNNKRWFDEHRTDYEHAVLGPARDFIMALGDRLRTIAPGIQADPRVNQTLFRINRDTRFGHDKAPYKTHLALWFWEGLRPRMECSGFYFHLEPSRLLLGVGLYCFPKDLLEAYRQSVVHPREGKALAQALSKIKGTGSYQIGGKHFKKIPSGYDAKHPEAEFLLYNGLHAAVDFEIFPEVFSAGLVGFCFTHFQNMLPLHRWLLALTQRV
jgi:uncharacterized protein (TIGR02453 family)